MNDYLSIIAISISIGSIIVGYGVLRQKVVQAEENDKRQDMSFNEYKEYARKQFELLHEFKNKFSPIVEHFEKIEDDVLIRLGKLEQKHTSLNEKISNVITQRDADNRYIQKELFEEFKGKISLMEKHIDEKFTKLEAQQEKTNSLLNEILRKIDKK